MKWILLIFMCLSYDAFAMEANKVETNNVLANIISANFIDTCSNWTSLRTEYGGYVYVCGYYPSRVQVPDYYSTQDVVRELESKISQLESRIQKLEANK